MEHWGGPFSLQRAWLAEFTPKGVAGRIHSKGHGWQKIFHILLKILTALPVMNRSLKDYFPN